MSLMNFGNFVFFLHVEVSSVAVVGIGIWSIRVEVDLGRWRKWIWRNSWEKWNKDGLEWVKLGCAGLDWYEKMKKKKKWI